MVITKTIGTFELMVNVGSAFDELPFAARVVPLLDAIRDAGQTDELGYIAAAAAALPPEQWQALVVEALRPCVVLFDGPTGRVQADLSRGRIEIDRAFGADGASLLSAIKEATEARLGNFTRGASGAASDKSAPPAGEGT
jgi:hypothetical protein